MQDYFIDPLGRGPKGPTPIHQQNGQHGIRYNYNENGSNEIMRNGSNIIAPIFPDAGFESSHLSSLGGGDASITQPQHLILPQSQRIPQQQQQQQQFHPDQQQPSKHSHTAFHSHHVLPSNYESEKRHCNQNNDDIPLSPMQVYMSSSSPASSYGRNTNKSTLKYPTSTTPQPIVHRYSSHENQLHADSRKQHVHPEHHHCLPSQPYQQQHTACVNPYRETYHEGNGHYYDTGEKYHEPVQRYQNDHIHVRNEQFEIPAKPSPPQIIDHPCRIVSSDSETVFRQNRNSQVHYNTNSANGSYRCESARKCTSSSHCSNKSHCLGNGSSSRLCCTGVVDSDNAHHFRFDDHRCNHNNAHRSGSSNNSCMNDACRHHCSSSSQKEFREYDPLIDYRLPHDCANCYHSYHRNDELREAPSPPTALLPLSPITIPSIVNSPAVASSRQCGYPLTSSVDATCSMGGSNCYDVKNHPTTNYGYDDHRIDAIREPCGCHSYPNTSKVVSKEYCQNHCGVNKQHRNSYTSTRDTESIPDCQYHTLLQHPQLMPPPTTIMHPHQHCTLSSQQKANHHLCTTCNKASTRLSVEIPSHYNMPHERNATTHSLGKRSPDHNHIKEHFGYSRSRTPNSHRSPTLQSDYHHHNHQLQPHYHQPPPPPQRQTTSVSFAEYEKNQSETRQLLIREIRQATTMRNSALADEDRKFWDRQIETLNQSFRQL